MLTLVSMPAFKAPPIEPITAASAQLNIRILFGGHTDQLRRRRVVGDGAHGQTDLRLLKECEQQRRDHQHDGENPDALDAPRGTEDRDEVVGIVGEQRGERETLPDFGNSRPLSEFRPWNSPMAMTTGANADRLSAGRIRPTSIAAPPTNASAAEMIIARTSGTPLSCSHHVISVENSAISPWAKLM